MSVRTASVRRPAVLTALVAVLLVAIGLAAPASLGAPAPPAPPAAPGGEPRDDEGATATLREQLDAASRGFIDARTKLANSQRRQRALAVQLKTLEADLAARTATLGDLASVAYRGGRLAAVSALLSSGSPEAFVDRVAALDTVAARQNQQVRGLVASRENVRRAEAAVANEIRQQRRQVEIMAARKTQAERALAAAIAEAGKPAAGPPAPPAPPPAPRAPAPAARKKAATPAPRPAPPRSGPPPAAPAPRNPDGSYPRESCRLDDPTTSGCITPRNLHALKQAKAAGFTRYVSCFRNGGSGEHPKGRACDYAAQRNGFGGVATGGDRTYGNNLANYFVRNADRLAVLYVIWFKEIWLPSSGWRTYSRAGGDPASDHTNHVHLSVY
ncbi:MAG TPA: hypothetical protein VFR67_01870 [Pilimelia sp.]|nr:hypothetical protein [Pilimelia sp.]